MKHLGLGVALYAIAIALVSAASADAQKLFDMKIYLGDRNELEVDAVYRDPADIDRRLNGTRVIPMRLTVTNRSAQPVSLDYNDVRLDLGGDAGLTRLNPVDPVTARRTLVADGRYNAFIRFIAGDDRFTNIDPFSKVFTSGRLTSGQKREGWVFFLRPELVPFTSFLALGTVAHPPKILSTNDFEVMSPQTEATSLWSTTFKSFETWARNKTDIIRRAVQEIVNGPPPFRTSYALLMGVSDYTYLTPLPRVNDDLARMSKTLRDLGFTIVRVENGRLTMANVRSPQKFFEERTITADDRLLVFFAGHGFPSEERGRVRGYLALKNARAGETGSATTIAMDDFVAWTQRVPAKHLLVLLESCFSGLAVGGRDVQLMGDSATATTTVPNPLALYQLSKDPGRYLVMAGDENQKIPMAETWGGGLFADAIIKGLQGRADADKDAFVTAHELYPWVRTYVSGEALKVLGTTVTPLIKDLNPVVSKGEFVFTKAKSS